MAERARRKGTDTAHGPAPSAPRPSSAAEAEADYVAARDAWIAALRAADSGRPGELASLAIAQQAYEAASAERDRWTAPEQPAQAPVSQADTRGRLDAVIGQEAEWQRIKAGGRDEGLMARIRRLFGG